MAATPSTITFKSGFNGTVEDGTTSWAQARNITLPDYTGGFVEELTLSGPQVFAEGQTSFGQFSFEIPQDGTACLVSATAKTWIIKGGPITNANGISASGHCIGDNGGTMTRGSSAVRTVTVKLAANFAVVT
jgi:hypothetical protein